MRYWAFIREGNWHGQRLIHATQYHAVHQIVHGRYPEFLSLNNYNPDGTIRSFRLVFDMDSTNVELARHDTAIVVARIGELTNCHPRIYFSGRKGYHIETDFLIEGERSHEVAGDMARRLFGDLQTLDPKIYRQRSLFRLHGSPASKPGFFKIRLAPTDLDINSLYHQDLSQDSKTWTPTEDDRPDYKRLTEMALESLKSLPAWSSYQPPSESDQNRELIVTPCIEKISRTPPEEGSKNLTVFVLARHLKQFGKSEKEALDDLLGNPNFTHANAQKIVHTVVKSLYQSKREVRAGCKGMSNEAALMRQFCDPWCPFNPEKLPTPTFRGKQ